MTVYVSTGREAVTVPNVPNKPLDQAKADLAAAGLVPGSETRENSPTVAADIVLATTPRPARPSRPADGELPISSGIVTLPDLTGQSLAAASSYLTADNLQLNAVPVPDGPARRSRAPRHPNQSLAPGRRAAAVRRSSSPTARAERRPGRYRAGCRRLAARRADERAQRARALARLGQAGHLEPVAEHAVAALGEHRLGVELHAEDRRRLGVGGP